MAERPAALTVDFSSGTPAAADGEWRALPYGVQIKLRTETGIVSAAIQARVARDLYGFRQGQDVLSRYGFNDDEAGLLADPNVALGFSMMLDAVIRAEMLIEDWNLVSPDGEVVPITAETIKALFNDGPIHGTGGIVMSAFQRLCDEPRLTRIDEGNASASSLNGATAGGLNTAGDAGSKEPPALAAASLKARAAPSTKTPRKLRKASPR